jgi:hypothetical protein
MRTIEIEIDHEHIRPDGTVLQLTLCGYVEPRMAATLETPEEGGVYLETATCEDDGTDWLPLMPPAECEALRVVLETWSEDETRFM